MKFISQLAKLVKRKKIFVMLYIANKLGQRINKYRATDKIKKKLKFKLRRRKTLRKLKNRKFKIFKKKWKITKIRFNIKKRFLRQNKNIKLGNKIALMRTKNKVYGSRQSLFVNKNIFAYKQYFLNKNIITIGSTISMYNNFIMRSHEFYKLISTFEKRRSLRFSTLRYKNIIKNLNFRRIKHKRKTKLIRRDRFWKLRRRRRRFKKYSKHLNKSAFLYYTNFYLNLGLEKIILFLIAKLNNNHTSTLYLKDLYKLKSTINQSHTYLYLNNRNFYAQTPFLEKLIDDVFKKNTNFYWKNNQIRKKRFFKNLVKKTNFLKYKHHHRIIKQSQSSRYYNIKNQTVLRKIRNQIFFKKYKKLRCNIYYKNICINSIFNLLNITNPAPSLSFFHLDENINNLKSKNNQPFIIQNTGLVLMSKINLTGNLLNNNKFKFKFKKKYFSFLAPNQLKKSILLIKSRIVISRFFYQNKKKFNIFKFNRFSHKNFLLKFTDFFKKNSLIGVTTPYFKPAHNNILDSTVFKQKGLDESFKIKEVFIPRIRFKPGYQRLWRQARTALKEALKLNYRYQYRLTRYLMRFSRKINSYYLYYSENTLERVVMYSKILPDLNSFYLFLDNYSVYLNGKMVYNSKRIIYPNDFIQLIVSQWYYAFYRWLFNWTTLRTRKFKRLVYRKGLAAKYKLMKTKKQRSRYTPNWIFNVRYDLIDIRPYLEVDYFTLSVFYVYEPFFDRNFPINDLSEKRHNIYRLYNWKYIT